MAVPPPSRPTVLDIAASLALWAELKPDCVTNRNDEGILQLFFPYVEQRRWEAHDALDELLQKILKYRKQEKNSSLKTLSKDKIEPMIEEIISKISELQEKTPQTNPSADAEELISGMSDSESSIPVPASQPKAALILIDSHSSSSPAPDLSNSDPAAASIKSPSPVSNVSSSHGSDPDRAELLVDGLNPQADPPNLAGNPESAGSVAEASGGIKPPLDSRKAETPSGSVNNSPLAQKRNSALSSSNSDFFDEEKMVANILENIDELGHLCEGLPQVPCRSLLFIALIYFSHAFARCLSAPRYFWNLSDTVLF